MTKKHFIALADMVVEIDRRIEEQINGYEIQEEVQEIVLEEVIVLCKQQAKGEFKEDRFRQYVSNAIRGGKRR